MKITIGCSTYGSSDQQQIAIESWRELEQKFNDVSLVNVQFNDSSTLLDQAHGTKTRGIDTIYTLTRSSEQIKGSTRKLPYMSDILSSISQQDCDYFIFTNSDIIINPNLIRYIQNEKPLAFACSRMDINPIQSFDDVLNKKITPQRTEIAGFDTFVFNKDWYKDNEHLFNDYLVGMPYWDQVYAMIMKLFGKNDSFGNKNPPFCFHVKHPIQWGDREAPERVHNHEMLINNKLDLHMWRLFDKYLTQELMRRTPNGVFINPLQNEDLFEKRYFYKMHTTIPG